MQLTCHGNLESQFSCSDVPLSLADPDADVDPKGIDSFVLT